MFKGGKRRRSIRKIDLQVSLKESLTVGLSTLFPLQDKGREVHVQTKRSNVTFDKFPPLVTKQLRERVLSTHYM